jgi:hypothetical protein
MPRQCMNHEQRMQVVKIVSDGDARGLNDTQIAAELSAHGCKLPSGRPIYPSDVDRYRGKNKKQLPQPARANQLAIAILTDPKLSDRQKVQMLIGYYEAAE